MRQHCSTRELPSRTVRRSLLSCSTSGAVDGALCCDSEHHLRGSLGGRAAASWQHGAGRQQDPRIWRLQFLLLLVAPAPAEEPVRQLRHAAGQSRVPSGHQLRQLRDEVGLGFRLQWHRDSLWWRRRQQQDFLQCSCPIDAIQRLLVAGDQGRHLREHGRQRAVVPRQQSGPLPATVPGLDEFTNWCANSRSDGRSDSDADLGSCLGFFCCTAWTS
jgi:hypothetical protein